MLKFFFWILLLANAGLFAYRDGYLDALFPSGREPGRMSRQLNADKIRLVPMPEPAAPPAPEPGVPVSDANPVVAPAPTPVASGAPASVSVAAKAVEPSPKKDADPICAEVGNFTADEARRFEAQLAPLVPGDRISRRAVAAVSHVVYIPPQGDREGAERKAEELRRLGISDYFVIQDNSSLRWGISLGVFKAEEAARAHLAALNQKGVRTARIGQRSTSSNLVAFQVRGIDDRTKAELERIRSGFPRQELRSCAGA